MAAWMPSPVAEPAAAATRPRPDKKDDPRNPIKRLNTFFDDGTLDLITAEDSSGMLCGVGLVRGIQVVAFASDASIQGGAMGEAGCLVILAAYRRAIADGVPVVGHLRIAIGGRRQPDGDEGCPDQPQ